MTSRTVIFAITLLSCLALSLNLHAQAGGDVADQIKQLQQEYRDAQMKNDAPWAQQHLADGFVAGNSWGDWQTREDFIKDLQNKTSKWKSGNMSDVKVATFGPNTAVSHYTFHLRCRTPGQAPGSNGHLQRHLAPAHGKRPRPTARWLRASSLA